MHRGIVVCSRKIHTSGHSIHSEWLRTMVKDTAALTTPRNIHVCDGSAKEADALIKSLLQSGTIEPIPKRPNSYLARSSPGDVARVEKQTYICSRDKADAGPNNNWEDPVTMKKELNGLFKGSMRNRTMYVIPFSMGPLGSDKSKLGVEITDSPYVALSMRVMTRMGTDALKLIEQSNGKGVVPCYHTLGHPLADGQKDVAWPCNDTKRIVHFPEERSIWSFGSGYGGNALLGKKCLALRIASVMAREEGWLAEHMLILELTSPEGKRYNIAAAFPSACGKTNLAMLRPSLPGWSVKTVGDDIAWMKFDGEGRLCAINPEAGFFGVAPGTSLSTNPSAMATVERDTIFTNVAKTLDGDVWWEGMGPAPSELIDWQGRPWTPARGEPAAHPNSRFCVPIDRCPTAAPNWADPRGVPIDAILFGGRRASTVPLVCEAFDWTHGTFMGASIASEQTAAAEGEVGSLRHDPFAMLPFCGYNMADYFAHWLSIPRKARDPAKLPRIFQVNWFRKDKHGKFMWPGFGENARVLKWVCQRLEDRDNRLATKTAIGYMPKEGALDLTGLKIDKHHMAELTRVDVEGWKSDFKQLHKYFKQFGDRFPKELTKQMEHIESALKKEH